MFLNACKEKISMDVLSKEDRRKNMQAIRSKDTKPERMVMDELKKRRIYFAKHVSKIEGRPDIVFRRKKVAVFIDSDFWHCNKKNFKMPRTNTEFWAEKISRNVKRDRYVNRTLKKQGWHVLRIWESDIKKNVDKCVDRIVHTLEKH